jgi:hypothetical protein
MPGSQFTTEIQISLMKVIHTWQSISPPKLQQIQEWQNSTMPISQNVPFSIRDNLDIGLNVTDESDLHFAKQSSP